MHHMFKNIQQNPALWDVYTRKEEYSSQRLDQYGRFIFRHSQHEDILDPVVSRYLIQEGFRVEYPDNKRFAVCLTHDVDEIYPPISHTLASSRHCLMEGDYARVKKQLFWRLKGKKASPYLNFKEIMDLEEVYDAKSSFYFLATDRDIRRFRYDVDDLEAEIGFINDSGWEVGLHGGYYAAGDLNEIKIEKNRLERILGKRIVGYRNHYLRFIVPDSWEQLSLAHFEYDTTLGYSGAIGFRNGMCHPFKPFNRNTHSELNLLELPLTVMDSTLFSTTKSQEDAWNHVRKCIDIVASYNGLLVLNWHSNSFNCPYKSFWPRMYEKILHYCVGKRAWITDAETITEFWKKNVLC